MNPLDYHIIELLSNSVMNNCTLQNKFSYILEANALNE